MNITVYLGANAGNDPALAEAVRELGSWIGANGHRLVYGGSRSGLMGQLAQSALDAPCILYDLNGYYDSLKALLAKMIEKGLSTPQRQQGIRFAANLEEITTILNKA